jgi:HTH-type transcriptional regulator/antitoxin HigA
MNGMNLNEYNPDWVSAPGDTIQDLLDERGMSRIELSELAGIHLTLVDELLSGEAPITPVLAESLERVFGATAQFWLTREKHYRDGRINQPPSTSTPPY